MPAPADVSVLSTATLPERRRRFDLRALAIVLLIHLLVIAAFLQLRPSADVTFPGVQREMAVIVSLPKPPVKKPVEPAGSGVKLAARPSPGLPAKKTRERALATLPAFDFASPLHVPAVSDPLPNLAAIDVASPNVGTGGTGKQGAGAGASGAGTGASGNGRGLFEECAATPERPMVATLYRLDPATTSLDGLTRRRTLKDVCLAQLNITPRPFRQGFPGLDGLIEWFGLDVRFTVNVPEAGERELLLVADDGAILSVDGVDVIDNDGLHQPRPLKAQVRLAAGPHQFRVRYFQGPGEALALMLAWKKPGEAEFDYIPPRLISRPAS